MSHKKRTPSSQAANVNPDTEQSSLANNANQTDNNVTSRTSSKVFLASAFNRIQGEQLHLITLGVLLIALLAVGAIFVYAKSVLIPFVLAMFISILASPVQTWLVVHLKLPFWVGFLASLLVVLSVVATLLLLLFISVKSVITGVHQYGEQLLTSIDQMTQWLNEWTKPWGFNVDLDTLKLNAQESMRNLATSSMIIF